MFDLRKKRRNLIKKIINTNVSGKTRKFQINNLKSQPKRSRLKTKRLLIVNYRK
jgi:hypothetical protein